MARAKGMPRMQLVQFRGLVFRVFFYRDSGKSNGKHYTGDCTGVYRVSV